ncbi:MAG: uroporphyrinogen decarboxylase family protein [Clostridia bacterium]|nr:uroporphyrinogen decarboxylase family protein [Clostridia bacterium]
MKLKQVLGECCIASKRKAIPILGFAAAKEKGYLLGELVKSSEKQAGLYEFIASETETAAVTALHDMSVEAEAFGCEAVITEYEAPGVAGCIVSDGETAEKLEIPSAGAGRTDAVIEALRLYKERGMDKPVIANMTGPFSLTGFLMDVNEILYTLYDEPETVHLVLSKAVSFLKEYGVSLKQAGADGLLVAEPLTGVLSPNLAAEFSMPYVKELIDALQDEDFPVIYHNCGSSAGAMLPEIYSQGAAAYHFGNATDLGAAIESAPEGCYIMGNIDPVSGFQNGTPESIYGSTKELILKCCHYPEFIASSGCDVPVSTSMENIRAFFQAVRDSRER